MKLSLKRDVEKVKREAAAKVEEIFAAPVLERPDEYFAKAYAALVGDEAAFEAEARARGMTPRELMLLARKRADEHVAASVEAAAKRVTVLKTINECATATEVDSVLERVLAYN